MGKVTSRTDPRSEARITPMHIVPVSIDDLPSDQYALLGLLFAFMAILTRVKLYSWITCLFSFASLANSRYSAMDSKTVMATMSLIFLTFVSTHTSLQGQPVLAPFFPWLKNKA